MGDEAEPWPITILPLPLGKKSDSTFGGPLPTLFSARSLKFETHPTRMGIFQFSGHFRLWESLRCLKNRHQEAALQMGTACQEIGSA